MKKKLTTVIFLYFLSSCTQDAFVLKKKNSTDEFLVEKKNPLVLPPDYGKLPVPQDNLDNKKDPSEFDIEEIFNKKTPSEVPEKNKDSNKNTLGELILEKIR